MGITIDECIEILHERDKCMEYVTDNDNEAFEDFADRLEQIEKKYADKSESEVQGAVSN